jgi:hypothetical protein
MISVKSLIYEIDYKLNKVATLVHQEIPLENKIIALNEAQIKLVKTKLNPNNTLNQGFEAHKKRYEDLQILIEPQHLHKLKLKLSDKRLYKWEASLRDLSPSYMFYLDAYVLAEKEECKNRVLFVNKDLTKHGDVAVLLANNNYKPSFEYQEVPCTLTSDKIEVYTDGTFTLSDLYLSYIRYPKKIDIEGYINLDGQPSVEQDCELADYLKDELLNLTMLELSMITENIPGVQATQERIKTQE